MFSLESGDSAAAAREIEAIRAYAPTQVAVGGSSAAEQIRQRLPDVPMVAFLVPNAIDAMSVLRSDSKLRIVAVDVRPDDLVAWVRRTDGSRRRVAVLYSDRTEGTAKSIAEAGKRAGLRIEPLRAERDKFPEAIDALNSSAFQGVIMIPDAGVYNSPNVERLLLWGVRGQHPVWAFSENIVGAGAFSGVFCDPRAVGETTAELVIDAIDRKPSPGPRVVYTSTFGAAINARTAEIIGIDLRRSEYDASVQWFGD